MFALITQKEGFNQYGEPADSLMRWNIDYVRSLGFTPVPVPNDLPTAREMAAGIGYGFLLVTGGGFASLEYFAGSCDDAVPQPLRDDVERFLVTDAVERGIPVMGLCRGMHMLNGMFGGHVVRGASHSAPRHDHYVAFGGGERMLVNTFHNNAIPADHLAPGAELLAVEEGTRNVEAFRLVDQRILGLQWHPERPLPGERAAQVTQTLLAWLLAGEALPPELAPYAVDGHLRA